MAFILSVALAGLAVTAVTGEAPNPDDETGSAPVAAQESKVNGDAVTLRSGRMLRGVRVLHSTGFTLLLEVSPTIEPLEIPLRQVTHIAYGEPVDAAVPAAPEPEVEEGGEEVLEAVKVDPDLAQKLRTPVSDKAIEFSEQDLVTLLRSVAILAEIPIRFAGELQPEAGEGPRVSVTMEAGESLEDFIHKVARTHAPGLQVRYHYDAIELYLAPRE